MKKILIFNALAAVSAVAMTGCSDDRDFAAESGEGSVILSATYNSDVKVVSRADLSEELSESTLIWISSEKGLVREYNGVNSLPAEGVKLVAGQYVAEAWAGDSVSASFDKRYFKGRTPFAITNGTERVDVLCKIANVVVTVSYDEEVRQSLGDYTMTVGTRRGTLDFVGDDDRHGYFMMPQGISDLTWTLKGTQVDGSTLEVSDVIKDVKPATQYNLRVIFNPETSEIGGGYFNIVVDESAIEVNDQITITAAPQISGYGFDLSKPVYAEPGMVGKRSVVVVGACQLAGFKVESDELNAIIGGNDVDFLKASDNVVAQLDAAGIQLQKFTDDNGVLDNLKFTLSKDFTATFGAGEHIFNFIATDANGKSSSAALNINVTEAKATVDEFDSSALTTTATSVRLTGEILKDDVVEAGVEYREVGTSEWTYVPGILTSRASRYFYVDLVNLKPNTNYEYRAVYDSVAGTIVLKFTTEAAVQLPNSSFEEWSTSGSTVIPGANLSSSFWDSGNHGSATMGKNITDKSSDYVHSGNYSAKLRSQFVGMGMIGKFAAGNIFAGNYLRTDGTDGELGWGRSFTSRPKSLSLWARYEPGTVVSGSNKGSGSHLSVGDTDKGVIYLALMDNHVEDYNQSGNYNGTSWPVVVKTKSSNRQLFDANSEHVIGYAEISFDSATSGDGLVQCKADIHYYRTDVRPSYIIFVASASRFGDYFEGGEGSTLYLDDIELIY